jgi:hypothetical protein
MGFSHAVLAVYQPNGLSRNPSTNGVEKATLCLCTNWNQAEHVRWYFGHLDNGMIGTAPFPHGGNDPKYQYPINDRFINTGVLGIVQEEVYEHQGKYYLADGSAVP